MKKKKLKLKKGVWILLILVVFLIIGSYSGIQIYKDYVYKKTYQYKLIEHGYSLEQAKILEEHFDHDEIEYFLNENVDERIFSLIEEKYFLKKNWKDYLAYMDTAKKKNADEVVRDINTHLNHKFYEQMQDANLELDTLMLVNKYYKLPSDYVPDDLVNVSTKYAWGDAGSKQVREIAYNAFLDMWNEAQNDGFYLMINSAYRSYQSQEKVYDDYMKKRGERYADTIAARPGSSEHQTGLSLDIFSKNNSNKNTFKDTEEALWLKDNAHRFGFTLRYPEDKVNITGYGFESWHYRYVGIEAATYIYENNITFDEYYAYFIEK